MSRLGSKRPRPEPPPPPPSIAELESRMLEAMGHAESERQHSDDCLAPQGKADHMAAAIRWDHLAVSYRKEIEARR